MGSKMKRFTGLLNRTKSSQSTSNGHDLNNAPADSPEANGRRSIRLFCESGSTSNGGEEVLHLPVIVEAAESSPTAAAAAAQQIKAFLKKEWSSKPYVQYNSVMLIRILSDHPGPTFTRNFDKSFVSTVKEVLRNCKDSSTQQILRETLDSLEANKQLQEGLEGLIQMWRNEKGQQASFNQSNRRQGAPVGANYVPGNDMVYGTPAQGREYSGGHRGGVRHQLPPPHELASRIEESRNTAKILLQLIQSTPAEEVLQNELIREFSERCHSAQRSMQSYINCDSPPPDDDTMLTLIETNEQLSLATTRYQRSLLSARKAMGMNPSPNSEAMQAGAGGFTNAPAPGQHQNLFAQPQSPPMPDGQSVFASGGAGYDPPPGPPPAMLNRLDSRGSQSPTHYDSANRKPQFQQPEQPSNPFADPVEHEANPGPLALDSSNYGTPPRSPPSRYHPRQVSQSFSIDSEPAYAPDNDDRTNATDRDSAYISTPIISTRTPSFSRQSGLPSEGIVSPNSPPRPGSSSWRHSGAPNSYHARQISGISGIMQAQPEADETVPEIDSHSDVGRRERSDSTAATSACSASPVEERAASPTARRVDVAGTGGLRDSRIGRTSYGV